LEHQRTAITTEVERRGATLVRIYEDAASGKSVDGRPGLADALAALRSGEATGLVIAKLDRLSRSVLDFAHMLERSQREGWTLVAIDFGADTATPAGRMMAGVLMQFAQYEREIISARTRDALGVRRRRGGHLGRPLSIPDDVIERIVAWRGEGLSYRAIVARLDAEGVPTSRGGSKWQPSTVRDALEVRSRV
jgi:DNA invertase Pin-like site-specific DNA recombinase